MFFLLLTLSFAKSTTATSTGSVNNFTFGFRDFKVYIACGWVDFTYNVWNEISNEQNPKVKLFTLPVDVGVVDFANLKVTIIYTKTQAKTTDLSGKTMEVTSSSSSYFV